MISYCTNVFQAETWEEIRKSLKTFMPKVRNELRSIDSSLAKEFIGLGLRLSAQAAYELVAQKGEIEKFKDWLDSEAFCVETMNGFPYGRFTGDVVKEKVFLPDWTSDERLEYTRNLFEILVQISDASILSVSTLPGSHRFFYPDREAMFARLEAMAIELDKLSQKQGRLCRLGLEPEPFGYFDESNGVIRFFDELRKYSKHPELVQKYLGITYDTCHAAVMRENIEDGLNALVDNGIPLVKVQLTNALVYHQQVDSSLSELEPFLDKVYFHQASIYRKDELQMVHDVETLFPAILKEKPTQAEWRLHYHIPLYAKPEWPFADTSEYISTTYRVLKQNPEWMPHLEVETYTWSVLPTHLRESIEIQIARELQYIHQIYEQH